MLQAVLNRMRDLIPASPGMSVLVAHHLSKGHRERSSFHALRGSSALGAWSDGLISIRKATDEWNAPRRVDVLHRDAPSPPPMGFTITTCNALEEAGEVPGCSVLQLEPCDPPRLEGPGRGYRQKAEALSRKEQVAEHLRTEKSTTSVQELAEKFKLSDKTIKRYIKELEDTGAVRRDGPAVMWTGKADK